MEQSNWECISTILLRSNVNDFRNGFYRVGNKVAHRAGKMIRILWFARLKNLFRHAVNCGMAPVCCMIWMHLHGALDASLQCAVSGNRDCLKPASCSLKCTCMFENSLLTITKMGRCYLCECGMTSVRDLGHCECFFFYHLSLVCLWNHIAMAVA